MSSLKDILRSITTFVNSSNSDVQPIIDLIDTFAALQDREKTEKISAELLTLFNSVQNNPQKIHAFLKCLRAMLPILGADIFITDWWGRVLLPVLHSPLQPKDIVEEVKGITRDILVCETERVTTFRKEILELYLKETNMVGKAAGEGKGVVGEQVHAFWCRNLDNVLRNFGGAKTKDFFDLLNSYFVQQKYRLQILSLLAEFIRCQSLHIHLILETPLLDSLLTSLQKDTSTTLISLSLTTLIMLLPHICTPVVSYLPRLYIIFVRILCWDKRNSSSMDYEDEVDDEVFVDSNYSPKEKKGDGWEQCDSTFDNIPSTPPNCLHFFTILYGMFPCNTVKFLRDPIKWLEEKESNPLYTKIDNDVIRSRSLPLLRRHTLHPNLVLSDSRKELSDTSRWMKLEPADVVAECMGLDMENTSTSSEMEDLTKKVLEQVDSVADTGTEKVRRTSQAISLQEIMDVHQALKSGADIVVGDDPWASKIISYSNSLTSPTDTSQLSVPSISNTKVNSSIPSSPSKPSALSSSNTQASISFLQREIMLLRNELNFELYLKQQHLQHIGRLHRDHVLDNRVEAESQNLYNTCRSLKSQLEQIQSAFNRQRDETSNIKKKHVQWADDLNTKLKKYREEKKEWKTEMDKLEQQLREAKLTISVQEKQIEESNAREADTHKFQEQKRLMEALVAQWHKMELKLEFGEAEIKQLKSLVSSQSRIIDDLKIKSESSLQNTRTNTLEKQMRIWTSERDRRDKEFKRLETNYENVKKHNEELQLRIVELLAQVESLTQPSQNLIARLIFGDIKKFELCVPFTKMKNFIEKESSDFYNFKLIKRIVSSISGGLFFLDTPL
ncbi:1711_t:CDS:10 [Acaulospora morrowiae]|uniref:1711_t:CDS:1 n=1 Tax=Acaulospora morrowiae TaxID=94023 RepID=A0A9N8V552_9GLOM|nr:1711_t:CDS:10 [Acaulospora morrowiae]